MAKKKETEETWGEKVERAVRKAVDSIPGLADIPEADYCEAVLEGIDVYREGIDMRAGELELDEEDDE